MNERIRELAEQANASFGERLEYAVVFGEMEDFEKFVDSIILECIDYCGENLSKTVGGALKIHFGVK